MTVEDWAQREAGEIYWAQEANGLAFQRGIVHAFSALLSDEAVEAAWWQMPGEVTKEHARAALQAAVDAVTKGETE